MFLVNCNVLDLFSGIGSFGLECISRNSKKLFFSKIIQKPLKFLKRIFKNLNIHKTEIIENDCFEFFNTKNTFREKFDIVFMDPPTKKKE